jgi:aminopeptidase
MQTILKKYAHLLVNYCLQIKDGDKLYISTTTLAEPLVKEVYREAIRKGAFVNVDLTFESQNHIMVSEGNDSQLSYIDTHVLDIMSTYDAYLSIRAPFDTLEDYTGLEEKLALRNQALSPVNKIYFDRIADKSLKRCLCQYPTQYSARLAGMSLDDYSHFVFAACNLYYEDAAAEWRKLSVMQQSIVDYLNKVDKMTYINEDSEIHFSVKGRTWINSDGKNNMPSGEVFSSPVEDSVNGHIHFTMPTIYEGELIENIRLKVENGTVTEASASKGQDKLLSILSRPGASRWGEVAIGTNYNITRPTYNILFDEKIGGTVHMALGQSYKQCGGWNESSVHWDLITDMSNGYILADGTKIYENGAFLI